MLGSSDMFWSKNHFFIHLSFICNGEWVGLFCSVKYEVEDSCKPLIWSRFGGLKTEKLFFVAETALDVQDNHKFIYRNCFSW